jgi:Mor family transcriptional regulator
MALPPVIQMLIEIIGHRATMSLVREFGGQELRIPREEGSDTWAALVEVIGERAMKRLAAEIGVEREIYIAKCERALKQDRNRKIIVRYEKLLRDGHSGRGAVSMLVREYKLSYRQIENIVNSILPEPSNTAVQAQLF